MIEIFEMREEDYRKLVIAEFDRQKRAGVLAPELLAPTRKDLRDHCVKVCTERYKKKDEPLLKSFYGERNSQAEYKIAVQNADAEDFRNLHNFIWKRRGRAFLNVCMLAWMIDFEPRPFRDDLEPPVIVVPEEGEIPESTAGPIPQAEVPVTAPVEGNPPLEIPEPEIPEPIFVTIDTDTDGKEPEKPLGPDRSKLKKRWVYGALIILLCTTAYYIITHQVTGNEGCMVWTGEKYRPVPCTYTPQNGGLAAIPLNTAVLKHFKKIMKDDTLTANSIGKVFCVKINGKYEYYTDSAANPVYPEKPLRVLTRYIMNNNP
jgi:hypothetical protein